jgi:hypothetical protein
MGLTFNRQTVAIISQRRGLKMNRWLMLCLLGAVLAEPAIGAERATRFTLDRPAEAAAATLKLQAPNGRVSELRFDADQPIVVDLNGAEAFADGSYVWELRFAPKLDGAARAALVRGDDGESTAGAPIAPLPARHGAFYVVDRALLPVTVEPRGAGKTGTRVGAKDQVIADDLIVQGSICAGIDCFDGENFGFTTIRLKENSTRIGFLDTSSGIGFPSVDWDLVANDNSSGGANYFGIGETTNPGAPLPTTMPFRIQAGAPTSALVVGAAGAIGLGTLTPFKGLHQVLGDTPLVRLEQSGSALTPQTWDVAGNEANFFVRDVTDGSKLPLRIFPRTPTNTLQLSPTGVSVTSGDPTARGALLHVRQVVADTNPVVLVDSRSGNSVTALLTLNQAGDLALNGTLTQLSSRDAKTGFAPIVGSALLEKLAALPIQTWTYRTADAGDRHIGPFAEDFFAAFGFGRTAQTLAPSDVAGVALAATQALEAELRAKDRAIAALEARLQRLEAALDARAESER